MNTEFPPPPPAIVPPLAPPYLPPAVLPPPVPSDIVVQVKSLPGLVRRASQTLANATTAAEVLEAKAQANLAYDAAKAAARFAKAKGAYDEVIGAVYRSQADALEIEAMAKRRFADEYDAAQERGEVADHGHGLKLGNNRPDIGMTNIGTVKELGFTSYDVHEARKAREPEVQQPGIVRQSLDAIVERGDEPSKAALTREINARLASFSGDNEWYTPARYIEMAREVMGDIDCDPASNERAQSVIKAKVYYTEQTNGLNKDWVGRVWLNPPYAHPEVQWFADRLLSELAAGRVTEAVVLTNSSGDTQWHRRLQDAAKRLCVVTGRIKFESGNGRESAGNAVGQTFLYFGPNGLKFCNVFSAIGAIYMRDWPAPPLPT